MSDDQKIIAFRAQGRFGEFLGRRAFCLEGVTPPSEDGIFWVEDQSQEKPDLPAKAKATLFKRGYVISS